MAVGIYQKQRRNLELIGLVDSIIEKSLLNQRVSNLTTARSSYVKKQNLALTALPSLN